MRRIDSISIVNYVAEIGLSSHLSLGTRFSIYYEAGTQFQLGNMDLKFRGGEDYYFVDGDRKLKYDRIEDIKSYNEAGNSLFYQEFGISGRFSNKKRLGKTNGRLTRRGFIFTVFARLFDVPGISIPNDIIIEKGSKHLPLSCK